MREANTEMLEGYHDGLAGEPEPGANRSASYRHGWLNGMDDRAGQARATADRLRLMADSAEAEDMAR